MARERKKKRIETKVSKQSPLPSCVFLVSLMRKIIFLIEESTPGVFRARLISREINRKGKKKERGEKRKKRTRFSSEEKTEHAYSNVF